MIKKKILPLLLLCFLFMTAVFPQSNPFLTPEKRQVFGDYLLRQKDYLRAVYEYQNVLSIVQNDTVKFKLAYCFDKMNRYTEAADNYKGLIFNSGLEDYAKIYLLKNRFTAGELNEFNKLAVNDLYIPESFRAELDRLNVYSKFYTNKKLPELDQFIAPFAESDKEIISGFYRRKMNPAKKDELTAGLLSVLLPGAGKFYTGEYTDGLTSLLLTGIFTYLAVDNLNDGHNTRGWIFTGVAAYFYAGNIYGSVASAQLFNARVEFNLMDEINKFLGGKNYFLPDTKFIY